MATPSFGGTNDVDELDLGQPGSARFTAGDARATVRVLIGSEQVAEVLNAMPQQDVVFVDVMGSQGRSIAWECTVRTTDDAEMRAVLAEIEQKRTGRNRATGLLDPAQMHPTQMVAHGETFLGVVLRDVQFRGPRYAISGGGDLTRLQQLVLIFQELGYVGG